MDKLNNIDQKILIYVQNWRRPLLNKFFIYFTMTGTGRAWFIVVVVLNVLNFANVRFYENQNQILRSMIPSLLTWVISTALKRIVSRARPADSIPGYVRNADSPQCGSFPSSHSATAFAFFAALLFISHPLTPFVGLWAVFIAFSRLYLGVHYLSDIIGGIVLGIGIATLLQNIII